MIIHTASEGITLSKQLETDSAALYEKLAGQYDEIADVLKSFAGENKKNIVQIERAYYGVITDAIEGGYAFDLDTDKYALPTEEAKNSLADVIAQVKEIENTIIRYYNDAAEQSKGLLADVPRAFTLVAKKRGNRLDKLNSL